MVGNFNHQVNSLSSQQINFIEKIAQLVRDKKIEGIRDIRDESNREVYE